MNESELMNELDPKAMLCFSFTDKGPPCRKMSLLHPLDRLCLEHCSCQSQPGPDSLIFCPHSPRRWYSLTTASSSACASLEKAWCARTTAAVPGRSASPREAS